MSELTDNMNKIDWKSGIISKEEAERFINRFAKVLLKKAVNEKVRLDREKKKIWNDPL